jgi:phage gp16-like protein
VWHFVYFAHIADSLAGRSLKLLARCIRKAFCCGTRVKNAANNKPEEGDRRRSELAKIHLAKKRLGLDDETYRAIIERVCGGKTSAGELDEGERGKLLDEFKRFGFIEGGSYTTSIADFDDREPQARLIRCLWADLKAIGALRDSSEQALADFIRRATKMDSIRWLTAQQANVVIESLKQWKGRIGYRQNSTGRGTH